MRDGQPFPLWGFNYWPSTSPGSAPAGGDWSGLCACDAPTIEHEVVAMVGLGANALRIWFAYAPDHRSADHSLTDTARTNLDHLLTTCASHGLYVIVHTRPAA